MTAKRHIPVSNTVSFISNLHNNSLRYGYNLTSPIYESCFVSHAGRPATEFAFGLEPIIQFATGLLTALKIDFICAISCFFVTRRVLRGKGSNFRAAYFGVGTFSCPWFR